MRLPDFLIIGTSRGGTTSLYQALRNRKGIFMPAQSELHFFSFGMSQRPDIPLSEYTRHFRQARREDVVGEKSPSYFWFPPAAKNIRQRLPSIKLIATLRDPALRAISDFKFASKSTLQEGDLIRSIDEGIRQLASGTPIGRSPLNPAVIIWKGFYGRHLRRFMQMFGEDRLLLIDFDSLSDGGRVLSEIAQFIGAPSSDGELPRVNSSGGSSSNYDQALERLRDFYQSADDYQAVRAGLRVV